MLYDKQFRKQENIQVLARYVFICILMWRRDCGCDVATGEADYSGRRHVFKKLEGLPLPWMCRSASSSGSRLVLRFSSRGGTFGDGACVSTLAMGRVDATVLKLCLLGPRPSLVTLRVSALLVNGVACLFVVVLPPAKGFRLEYAIHKTSPCEHPYLLGLGPWLVRHGGNKFGLCLCRTVVLVFKVCWEGWGGVARLVE